VVEVILLVIVVLTGLSQPRFGAGAFEVVEKLFSKLSLHQALSVVFVDVAAFALNSSVVRLAGVPAPLATAATRDAGVGIVCRETWLSAVEAVIAVSRRTAPLAPTTTEWRQCYA
jgi:hypothetical protein